MAPGGPESGSAEFMKALSRCIAAAMVGPAGGETRVGVLRRLTVAAWCGLEVFARTLKKTQIAAAAARLVTAKPVAERRRRSSAGSGRAPMTALTRRDSKSGEGSATSIEARTDFTRRTSASSARQQSQS